MNVRIERIGLYELPTVHSYKFNERVKELGQMIKLT